MTNIFNDNNVDYNIIEDIFDKVKSQAEIIYNLAV